MSLETLYPVKLILNLRSDVSYERCVRLIFERGDLAVRRTLSDAATILSVFMSDPLALTIFSLGIILTLGGTVKSIPFSMSLVSFYLVLCNGKI